MHLHKPATLIHPRTAVIMHDLVMVALAWWLAKLLRYALLGNVEATPLLASEFLIVLAAQTSVFIWTGLYRGLWRFASMPDLWNIVRGVILGAILVGIALFLYDRLEGVPRTVLLIYPVILAILLGLPRIVYRYWKDSHLDLFQDGQVRKVLVLGAGRAGEGLVRGLRCDSRYRIIGFLDDNKTLSGARIQGLPVLGGIDRLPDIAHELAADMLLIAMPSATASQMQRVVDLCVSTKQVFRTLPKFEDIVAGRAQINQLRDVAIEDLLGRDTVSLDWAAIRNSLTGKHVLITGGGGSIGSEMCRQIARLGAASLSILESCEFNLYCIEQELKQIAPELLVHTLLGDCGDPAVAEHAMRISRPAMVFHAAAYKHVPMLQDQVREAVRNNILATYCMARAADRHGCGCFVLISTDKAVNPTSIMGASKHIAEMVCLAQAYESTTRFITVRFGNVLDSAGSVVPLFREQIASGGPVTVTHPEITRYFMTIPEACELILQASAMGRGKDIYALDMGQPVRIRDLAEQMIRLSGRQPGSDIAITYTGLRPGEKLFEELFHQQEKYAPTAHVKLYLAKPRPVAGKHLEHVLGQFSEAVENFDEPVLYELIYNLLPGFQVQMKQGSAEVIPFVRGSQGEQA